MMEINLVKPKKATKTKKKTGKKAKRVSAHAKQVVKRSA